MYWTGEKNLWDGEEIWGPCAISRRFIIKARFIIRALCLEETTELYQTHPTFTKVAVRRILLWTNLKDLQSKIYTRAHFFAVLFVGLFESWAFGVCRWKIWIWRRHIAHDNIFREFRQAVKVGQYIRADHPESRACSHNFYKKIITITGDDWKNKTLQDVEEFKNELSERYRFQTFLTLIHVQHSSIAIVFSVPHWLQINIEEIEPFLFMKKVIKVFLGNTCLIDWTKQVSNKLYSYIVLSPGIPHYYYSALEKGDVRMCTWL